MQDVLQNLTLEDVKTENDNDDDDGGDDDIVGAYDAHNVDNVMMLMMMMMMMMMMLLLLLLLLLLTLTLMLMLLVIFQKTPAAMDRFQRAWRRQAAASILQSVTSKPKVISEGWHPLPSRVPCQSSPPKRLFFCDSSGVLQ